MTKPPDEKVPDLCDGNFDVITNVRKEIFIFKGKVFGRRNIITESNFQMSFVIRNI